MTTYRYTALSRDGEKVNGITEGFNELDATTRIKERYSVILKMKPVRELKSGILNMEIGSNKLNPKAFTLMCSQFSTILRSGIPISRAVLLIAQKTGDKKLKHILENVAKDVEAGRSLSSAFEEHGGKLFPVTFVETLRAGEESGNLPNAFTSIYQHFDKQSKMMGKVKSALAYPMFVLLIAVVVMIVLMVGVVPSFLQIFDSLGGELPLMTRMLIAISNGTKAGLPYFVAFVVIFILAIKLYGGTEQGRINLAKIQLKLPVLGNIVELNAASQFANTMATMVGAGIPLTKSVTVTGRVMENYWIRKNVEGMTGKIEEGRSVAESMRESGCLPEILTDMVGVGEESGEMKDTLDTVALYYDAELDQAIQSAIAKLEPGLLCFIAVVAGFIVIAIYMAMFDMYSMM